MSTYAAAPPAPPRAFATTPDSRFTLLGDVVGHRVVGRTLVLETAAGVGADVGGPRLAVTFLAGDVLRVRLAPTGNFADGGHGADADDDPFSYALDPGTRWPGLVPQVQVHPDQLVVETPSLRLRVFLRPCRLRVETPDGRVISEDSAGAGWARDGGRTEVRCWKSLAPEARFFGLGDKTFELDRRGRVLTFWNADTYAYAPEQDPIYKSIPFALTLAPSAPTTDAGEPAGDAAWTGGGLFFDNSYRSQMDLGSGGAPDWWFGAVDGELRYYVFAPGDGRAALTHPLRRYCDLTGHKPMPARWSLGYHQSRWNYHDEGYARWVAHEFRRRELPLDCIHLDIGHMDGYRVFTWDADAFPDPQELNRDFAELGIRSVVIVDPGVKVDPGYFAYREGKAARLFCENPDGSDFTDTVWPGDVHWPDFSKPAARRWWGETHQRYLDAGVTGFWNDMNEPAILGGRDFPDDVRFAFADRGSGATDHREAHNVYGLLMARATFEGLREVRPAERPFLLTRACFSGSQRYAAAWTGDNVSTWEHLLLSIRICQSLSASGLAFCGPDIGGFAGQASPELFARWMQAGVLYPFMRTHYSHEATGEQEPWSYGPEVEAICRRYLTLRYRLLPTLYSAFERCTRTAEPPMRALFLEHPSDPNVHRGVDHQTYLGEHLLAAPVVADGQRTQDVYLPDTAADGGTGADWMDFWTGAALAGGTTHTVPAPLDTMPLFVRGGGVVALDPPALTTESVPDVLTFVAAPGAGTSHFYFDDGISYAHEDGDWLRLTVEQTAAGAFSVRREGTRGLPYTSFEWRVPAAGRAGTATADGADAEVRRDGHWLVVTTRTDVEHVAFA